MVEPATVDNVLTATVDGLIGQEASLQRARAGRSGSEISCRPYLSHEYGQGSKGV